VLGSINVDRFKEGRKIISTGVIQEVRVLCHRLSQDETLLHYFEHEFKHQLMERCHITSPGKKKFRECAVSRINYGLSFGMGKVIVL
jgi:hypothetical protein